MKRLVLAVLAACGSSTAPPPPAVAPKAPPPAPVIGRLVTAEEWIGTTKEIRATGKDVPLDQIAVLASTIGLPVSGKADVDLLIDVPNGSAAAITGHVELACMKCRIGDDVAKLKLPSGTVKKTSGFAGDGILFGHIDLDAMTVSIAIENGRAEIKTWKVASPDVALEITGHVELAATVEDSRVAGCIRFKLDPGLSDRQPKTFAMLSVTGAPLGDDGFFSIELAGTIGQMKRLAKVCH